MLLESQLKESSNLATSYSSHMADYAERLGLDPSDLSLVSPLEAYFPTIPPLNVELGSRCNLKCTYCANPTLKREYSRMSEDIIDVVVRQAQQFSLKVVGFHGVGEPLLRKDLESILRIFREAAVWEGALTSNCTLLSLNRMTSLKDAGLTFLYCSVDTLDPELYRRTRGGHLKKVLANVKNAAAAFPEVQFVVGLMNHKSQVVTPAFETQFAEIFCGLKNVRCAPYENGRFPGAAEDWSREERRGGFLTCQAPAAYLSIDDQGKVALCCADQNTEHVLGDITQHSIAEIWYSRRNQETFRSTSLGLSDCPNVCYKCVLKKSHKSLEDAEDLLYAPIYQMISEVVNELANGNFAQAQNLLRHACNRDPYSEQLKSLQDNLSKKGVSPLRSYFEKYRSGNTGASN
jgi:radical SAM protein with 4Fe4S-binding SPASM domain